MTILSRVIRKLVRKIPFLNWFTVMPPFDYVQAVNEYNVHRYLGQSNEDIKSWVIVGGHLGNEIPTILANYPNCQVTVFECSQRYLSQLKKRFAKETRVEVIGKAVSDCTGSVDFYETNLKGSGSVLKVGKLAQSSYGMEQAEAFPVEAIRLDEYLQDNQLDVLQLDVQGAELKVLQGATQSLKHVRAVFSEVSVKPNLYQGAVVIDDLNKELKRAGFHLVLLGTDINLTGNALYIKTT